MKIEEILERELYDSLINSSSFVHGFQLWGYGNVKRLQGWKPQRFVILDDDKIIGGFQLLVKNIFGIKVGIVPFGPVLLGRIKVYNSSMKFQTCFKDFVKREKMFILLVHPYFDNTLNEIFSSFPRLDQGISYRYTYIIDLRDSLDSIFGRFSATSRNEIRKSLRQDELEIEYGNTENMYVRFYHLLEETISRTKGSYPPLGFFKEINKELGKDGNAIVFISSFKDIDVSGVLLLSAGKTLVYQWAALTNDERFMRLYSQRRLIYEAIKWAKEQGYYYFDLGGVSLDAPKGTKKWGIWFFKQSFGGELKGIQSSFVLSGNQFLSNLMVDLYRYYRMVLYRLGRE